jgi:pimeloyl-ACP methyl ester carboxylesterase
MKQRVKRSGLVAAIVLLGVLAGVNIIAYRQAGFMMRYVKEGKRTGKPESLSLTEKVGVLLNGVTVPRPETPDSVRAKAAEYTDLTITCCDSIRLGCWYYSFGDATPLVILFHGYAAEKSTLLPEAAAFREFGLSVLLVDFRGSGQSSESYTTIGFDEAEDVTSVMEFARENLPHKRIVLFGQSMGAAAVLRAVDHFDVAPEAIIVESVFDRLINSVRSRFHAMGIPSFPGAELLLLWGGERAGFDGFSHNPMEYASAVTCPILFLQGADDFRARPGEARRVWEAVPSEKEYHSFSGVGHESIVSKSPELWRQVVARFLDKRGFLDERRTH